MRISDWSSDVCSSDLIIDDIKEKAISKEIMIIGGGLIYQAFQEQYDKFYLTEISGKNFTTKNKEVTYFETDLKKRIAEKQWTNKIIDWFIEENQIGRASCRERVCQYV